MRNFARVAQLALVPGFALITIGMASVAEADANLNAQLRGAYALTQTRICTVSSQPFGENLEIPSNTFVFSQTATDNGIITYNGDGTATFVGRTSTNSTGGSAIFLSDVTTAVEYMVNPDGTVDQRFSSSFAVVFPATGIIGTVTGGVGRLQISGGNTMLVSAPAAAPISAETVVTTTPAGTSTQYRACSRSTTQSKLPG